MIRLHGKHSEETSLRNNYYRCRLGPKPEPEIIRCVCRSLLHITFRYTAEKWGEKALGKVVESWWRGGWRVDRELRMTTKQMKSMKMNYGHQHVQRGYRKRLGLVDGPVEGVTDNTPTTLKCKIVNKQRVQKKTRLPWTGWTGGGRWTRLE